MESHDARNFESSHGSVLQAFTTKRHTEVIGNVSENHVGLARYARCQQWYINR